MVLLAFLYCGFRLLYHTLFTVTFFMERRMQESIYEGTDAAIWVLPCLGFACMLNLRIRR